MEIVRNFKIEINIPISKDMFFEDRDLQYSTRFADKRIEFDVVDQKWTNS